MVRSLLQVILFGLLSGVLVACTGASLQIIPTELPTITPTFTPSPSPTRDANLTPTPFPTRVVQVGGPSPTPLLGATRTPLPVDFQPTATRILNPNAPRLEFFTSDPLAVEPGESVTLFWSARNIDTAVIYRLNSAGERTQVFNVPPDGRLDVTTNRSDRGQLDFLVRVGEGSTIDELTLTIPLQCPIDWFFAPPPEACPEDPALETQIIDQSFERGRMLYVRESNTIYVLFNDGEQPAWQTFESEYNPDIHPERDPNAPPNFIQPLRELGFLWRTSDVVRNRLGLGLQEANTFEGFVQATELGSDLSIYISGAERNIIHAVSGNQLWQLLVPSTR